MKQQQVHLHPPGLKSPPSGIHKLYPYPQAILPSPPRKKGLFLKMLGEEASAVAIELLLGSQGWMPVSDVMHSLISWQDLSDWDTSVEIMAVLFTDMHVS